MILGTSSLTGSFARVLAAKFRNAPEKFPNLDGVVAIAHTEGGEAGRPNNLELSLRTLAGWVTNNTDCDDAATMYADADRDGFGAGAKIACDGVTNNTDCNDASASVYPGAPDTPYDGIDQDCSGSDEADSRSS